MSANSGVSVIVQIWGSVPESGNVSLRRRLPEGPLFIEIYAARPMLCNDLGLGPFPLDLEKQNVLQSLGPAMRSPSSSAPRHVPHSNAISLTHTHRYSRDQQNASTNSAFVQSNAWFC